MGEYQFDDSHHPLVVVRFLGVLTDDQFAQYLDDLTRNLERRQKTVVILDARRSGATPAAQRRMQADWLKEYEPLLRQYTLGTAFVISSRVVRGILTAILWVQPLPSEHVVVSTLAEALAWASERFAEHGITMPTYALPAS